MEADIVLSCADAELNEYQISGDYVFYPDARTLAGSFQSPVAGEEYPVILGNPMTMEDSGGFSYFDDSSVLMYAAEKDLFYWMDRLLYGHTSFMGYVYTTAYTPPEPPKKAAYIGVEGRARKAAKMYVGIGGAAQKVKKAYIGDQYGRAQLFFMGTT